MPGVKEAGLPNRLQKCFAILTCRQTDVNFYQNFHRNSIRMKSGRGG